MRSHQQHFLHQFLHPASVAVVGATENHLSNNYYLLANLVNRGYRGKIYPVNPKGGEILGVKTYTSIKHIDEVPDLVVISVPYSGVMDVLKECIAKGVKRVTIIAGGFSEAGDKGKGLQRQMADLLKENGIRAIGPNALSPINIAENFAISFHPLEKIKRGGLSLVFQSGLYEPRTPWLFSEFNLYLNKLLDLGNKMDINEVDALAYLVDDPETRVIGIHLESIVGDGREFLRLIKKATREKHVVILKSGRTEAGARAAASHTGAMVQGSDILFDAAIRQAGAVRAYNIEDFFEIARALDRFGSLTMKGNRIVIGTFPGGEAVITTDVCQQMGLSPAIVNSKTYDSLSSIFPPWKMSGNPFDVGVSIQFNDPRKVFRTLIEAMVKDPGVDALALELIIPAIRWNVFPKEMFQEFYRAVDARKPIVLWIPGMRAGGYEILEQMEDRHIPVFSSAPDALKALSALYRSSQFKHPG